MPNTAKKNSSVLLIYILLLLLGTLNSYAWNARGHQLIAQIAYDNLSSSSVQMCKQYCFPQAKQVSSDRLISTSTWLDTIRRKKNHQFDALHYIDIPFSKDKSRLPFIAKTNALWGIKQAERVLSSSQASIKDKELSFRILTHLVGDVHQPLHTITKVSKRLPRGDAGGNLFYLAKNSIGKNLHQYWDNGGGILIGKNKKISLQQQAAELERKWSCAEANKEQEPEQWVEATHQIAVSQVYSIQSHRKPSKKYQLATQLLVEKQIVFAGCRLANLLNKIAITR